MSIKKSLFVAVVILLAITTIAKNANAATAKKMCYQFMTMNFWMGTLEQSYTGNAVECPAKSCCSYVRYDQGKVEGGGWASYAGGCTECYRGLANNDGKDILDKIVFSGKPTTYTNNEIGVLSTLLTTADLKSLSQAGNLKELTGENSQAITANTILKNAKKINLCQVFNVNDDNFVPVYYMCLSKKCGSDISKKACASTNTATTLNSTTLTDQLVKANPQANAYSTLTNAYNLCQRFIIDYNNLYPNYQPIQ